MSLNFKKLLKNTPKYKHDPNIERIVNAAEQGLKGEIIKDPSKDFFHYTMELNLSDSEMKEIISKISNLYIMTGLTQITIKNHSLGRYVTPIEYRKPSITFSVSRL